MDATQIKQKFVFENAIIFIYRDEDDVFFFLFDFNENKIF